jgi:hypothetical protein
MANEKPVTGSLETVAYRVLLGSLVGTATVEACLATEDCGAAAAPDRLARALDSLATKLAQLVADREASG